MTCEECWKNSRADDSDDAYQKQMRLAEDRGDECTKPTLAGQRLRAGQFWDEDRGIDTRTLLQRPTVAGGR